MCLFLFDFYIFVIIISYITREFTEEDENIGQSSQSLTDDGINGNVAKKECENHIKIKNQKNNNGNDVLLTHSQNKKVTQMNKLHPQSIENAKSMPTRSTSLTAANIKENVTISLTDTTLKSDKSDSSLDIKLTRSDKSSKTSIESSSSSSLGTIEDHSKEEGHSDDDEER